MGGLVGGGKYKGELEEGVKGVVNEVKKWEGEMIVLMEEIERLVGGGKGEGGMDGK